MELRDHSKKIRKKSSKKNLSEDRKSRKPEKIDGIKKQRY